MPVTGLVIVLNQPGDADALRRLAGNRLLTLGSAGTPQRVPAVLETEDHRESKRQLQWLERQPGVAMIEVISVDFSDIDSCPPNRADPGPCS